MKKFTLIIVVLMLFFCGNGNFNCGYAQPSCSELVPDYPDCPQDCDWGEWQEMQLDYTFPDESCTGCIIHVHVCYRVCNTDPSLFQIKATNITGYSGNCDPPCVPPIISGDEYKNSLVFNWYFTLFEEAASIKLADLNNLAEAYAYTYGTCASYCYTNNMHGPLINKTVCYLNGQPIPGFCCKVTYHVYTDGSGNKKVTFKVESSGIEDCIDAVPNPNMICPEGWKQTPCVHDCPN